MNKQPFVVILTACVCMTLWSALAHAQAMTCNGHPGTSTEYRAQALELRGTFVLLPSLREVYKGDKPAYGSGSEMFAGSTNALALYRADEALTIASAVTGVLGLAAVVSGVVVAAPWRSDGHAAPGVLITGGGVLLLFGAIFLRDMASSRLNDAVNIYNGELAQRLR